MKTNTGLVEHAQKALSEGWGYVWGTFGQLLTEALFAQKLQQYPSGVGNYESFIRTHWLGRRTADCVGLIKSYMWWGDNGPEYTPGTDVSADGMFSGATEKGSIDTIPEIPGLCLWKSGHIGVYIGNGQVIEARGTMYGVIASSLTSNNPGWTHWLKCPFITYEETGGNTMAEISIGAIGGPVVALQKGLNKYGYGLTEDGNFGPKTDAAVKDFQTKCKLEATGVVDLKTWEYIDGGIPKEEPAAVEVPQWKKDGAQYLKDEGITEQLHDPLEIPDLGTLGTIMKKFKEDLKKELATAMGNIPIGK